MNNNEETMTTATVLLVEDDSVSAAHLASLCLQLGYGVLGPAATGAEALGLLSQQDADLALINIALNGPNKGVETAAQINRLTDIPIVFLSATAQDFSRPQARITPSPSCLVKPVAKQELAVALAVHLHGQSLSRQLKASQQALQASEAKYRHLFEHSPLGIFRTTIDGRLLMANGEMARMVGAASPEEAVATITDIGNQVYADPGRRLQFLSLLHEHGEVRGFEFQVRQQNGEISWLAMDARLHRRSDAHKDGQQLIDGFAMDITTRKKAELALQESEQRHRTYLMNTPYGVFAADLEGRIVQVNPSACRLSGYEEHELLAMTVADLHFQEYGNNAWNHFHTALAQGRFQGEMPIRIKSGEQRWWSVTAIKIANQRILGFCNDITERKRVEAALEKRMLTLLQPFDTVEGLTIEDLFNVAELQLFQDQFAEGTGVGSLITLPDGTPVTKPSNFTRLCADIIRRNPLGLANCQHSDALVGRGCIDGPNVRRCLGAGLWNAGAAIVVGGRHIATWLIGQVRDESQTEDMMRAYARTIGADEDAFIEAFYQVPAMSREQFARIGKALFTLVTRLSASAYQTVQQARFITESHQTEEALRASQERLQRLFRIAPTGIGVVRDRVFVEVNARVCAMTGYTAEELIGQNARMVYPTQEDYDFVGTEKYRQISEKGFGEVETRWQRKDGSIIDIFMASILLDPADASKGSMFTALDITARKQTESLLRASENRYRELVENANSIILRMDKEGTLSFFNEYAQRFFGLTSTEVLGKNVVGLLVPETDSAGRNLRAMIADIGRHPNRFATNENENILRDGTRVWISWTNKPFFDEQGQVTEILCVGNDITELKRAEEEKRALQVQLNQAQKLEAIGTLAGGIAHDFNNILAAIIGYSEMIREEVADGTFMARNIDQILKAGHRAKDLVKHILAFSRQSSTEATVFMPAIIIREAVKLLRPSLPTTITISQQIDPKAGPICIDPTQFHQVLMNLCTNAFHAMEGQNGVLTINLAKVFMDGASLPPLSQSGPGEYVVLSVRDTGTGIAEAIRTRIFDPFFTTKEAGKGTGMGLSIIHGIVTKCGGFVTLESMVGKGTEFRVHLPVTEQEVGRERLEVEEAADGSGHILFVDDETILVEMATNILQKLGYQVTALTSSIEALATFSANPAQYDLVITDQTMPGMTGLELSRHVLALRPDLPIILCTGYGALLNKDEVYSQGIRELVLKPLTKNELALVIKKVLTPVP